MISTKASISPKLMVSVPTEMKLVLYAGIALSATIVAIGVIYLIADNVLFESRKASKPWHQHPLVRLSVVGTIGILVPWQ